MVLARLSLVTSCPVSSLSRPCFGFCGRRTFRMPAHEPSSTTEFSQIALSERAALCTSLFNIFSKTKSPADRAQCRCSISCKVTGPIQGFLAIGLFVDSSHSASAHARDTVCQWLSTDAPSLSPLSYIAKPETKALVKKCLVTGFCKEVRSKYGLVCGCGRSSISQRKTK